MRQRLKPLLFVHKENTIARVIAAAIFVFRVAGVRWLIPLSFFWR